MKTRSWMMVLVAVAVVGLSGCASPFTREKIQSRFEFGESTMYMRAGPPNTNIENMKCTLKEADKLQYSENGVKHFENEICPNLSKYNLVRGIFYTHPRKGIMTITAYSPKTIDIQRGDILKISTIVNPEGTAERPAYVIGVARKEKDATKESGCYWEGGAMFTNAFISGGVVCDGWDWKKQKFAQ